ncbi:MAG: mannonate dehydratase, partial [Terriglobia bacterium]
MLKYSRRQCIRGLAATATAAAVPSAAALALPSAASAAVRAAPMMQSGKMIDPNQDAIKLCLVWDLHQTHLIRLARQMGVTHSIAGTEGALSKVPREKYVDTLAKLKAEYDAAGMTIAGVESHPVPAEKIKLGLPGRDEEIENYIAAIEALSKVGIRMVCYDFMAGIDWYRTTVNQPGRGGALSLAFDNRAAGKQG